MSFVIIWISDESKKPSSKIFLARKLAIRSTFISVCLTLLLGCGTSVDEPVSRAYGEAVRELGIFPVFPPREEFQVGDVYIWSQSTRNPSDTLSVYISSLDWVRHEANTFLRSRVVFQNTSVNNAGTNRLDQSDFPNDVGTAQTRGEIADASLLASLPITALPRVSADAGFTSGLGLVNLLSSLGLVGGSRTTVTLDFTDVRTYWVPNVQVVGQIDSLAPQIVGNYYGAGLRELSRSLQLRDRVSSDPCGVGRTCGMSVITRVYLTRQIDYTYRNGKIIAAGLQRADTIPEDGTPTRPPSAPTVTVNIATNADGTVDGAQTEAQIAALRQQLTTLSTSTSRGQSLQFQAWDARGITFSQLYQRPVAVAWDGIEFEITESRPGG